MTVTGKVQKFRLREAAIAELGLQRRGEGDGVIGVIRAVTAHRVAA